MIKKLCRLSVAVLGLLMLAAWSWAADFTADMVTRMGKMTMSGKVYRQGKKVRQEGAMGGGKQIAIVRPDKKVVWIIFPATKTYMESAQRSNIDVAAFTDPANLKKYGTTKSLGRESVRGYVCEKTLFIAKEKSMGISTLWVSKELQWPLKSESKGPRGAVAMDCKNIKTGPLSAALFEVPKGYKKLAMPKMPMMPPGKAR